ncbi:MAG: FAD-dependent oxidoreductase [Burkholderiales bacterium]|nr:FAD-dependent oxidoreductase [Burkholderiales bacterium]
MTASPIAIVGAGIAGLAAARRLADAGHPVAVFDKGRGLGGRMATRRADGFVFDHGAQFFRVRGSAMGAALSAWRDAGAADAWFDDAFVGTPGMTAPARALAAGLAVRTECTVTGLSKGGSGWTLVDAAGPVAHPSNGAFAAVILAVPSPQAIPLAASAGVAMPGLADAVYAPCWALMLGFAGPLAGVKDRIEPASREIAWVARNATKPGRGEGEAIVVHARPDWSRAQLERDASAIPALLTVSLAGLGIDIHAARYVAAHRWRYAQVETPAGSPFLHDPSGLYACGDWCIGGRVEAAFDSGHAAAGAVMAEVGR